MHVFPDGRSGGVPLSVRMCANVLAWLRMRVEFIRIFLRFWLVSCRSNRDTWPSGLKCSLSVRAFKQQWFVWIRVTITPLDVVLINMATTPANKTTPIYHTRRNSFLSFFQFFFLFLSFLFSFFRLCFLSFSLLYFILFSSFNQFSSFFISHFFL